MYKTKEERDQALKKERETDKRRLHFEDDSVKEHGYDLLLIFANSKTIDDIFGSMINGFTFLMSGITAASAMIPKLGLYISPMLASATTTMVTAMKMAAPVASCLLYTSPSPRDVEESRMPSSA